MSQIQSSQGVNPSTFDEADLFAAYSAKAARPASRCSSSAPDRIGATGPIFPATPPTWRWPEMLESFVGQFYDERTAPKLMLTSEELPGRALLAEALALRAGHKVEISMPQRGEKREIMERALTNAREQLGRRMAENSAQTPIAGRRGGGVRLDAPPRRIEVYDNSHIQGAHAMGAFIVAGPEGFEKAQYRKFNIKTAELTPGDDYAMMREVLTRRFARLIKEEIRAGADNSKWRGPIWC